MTARLLDGKALAATIQAETAAGVAALVQRGATPPGLATVLVGENPASQVYVRNKRRTCERLGMRSFHHDLPATTGEPHLLGLIAQLNADPAVHGILVQLPLPRQIEEKAVLLAIDPRKDVDGFHPENLGLLAAGHPRFLPCTPAGVVELLVRNGIDPAGKRAVIVGRSNIVGKPLALLMMQKRRGGNATVTVCHSQTPDLPGVTREADILVAAIGVREFVTAEMVKPGAVVIDVGMNKRDDGTLCGDVAFAAVSRVASAITPVPGGVGPMTIAMLLANTLRGAEERGAGCGERGAGRE